MTSTMTGAARASADEPPGQEKWLRIWRSLESGVLAVHFRAHTYESDPHGEYVFGHLAESSIEVERGGRRLLMRPGELALMDPSAEHRGASVGDAVWESRALVVELPYIADVVTDPDGCALDVEFPDPIRRDPTRAAEFLRLHRTLTGTSSTLEREVGLASWLQGITRLASTVEVRRRQDTRRSARRDPALRLAREMLADNLVRDLDLDALCAAAGTNRFRLLRLFKAGLGLPPHDYQVQLRVQRAPRAAGARRTGHVGGSPGRVLRPEPPESALPETLRRGSRPLCAVVHWLGRLVLQP